VQAGWRRPGFALLALLAATASSLVLGEAVVRLGGLEGEVRAHFVPGIFAPDEVLDWVLLPSYRGVRLEDDRRVPASTNAMGFRGPEWSPERANAVLRVLVLGDSCTFGLGVADDETWPSYLEQALRERGLDAAVFNAGVPGYDTIQEAEILERLAEEIRPQVVIVTWVMNDTFSTPRDERPEWHVVDGYLVDDLESYRTWRDGVDHRGIHRSALYRFVRVRLRLLKDMIGMGRRTWSPNSAEAFRNTTDALSTITEGARRLGARAILVPIPRREQVEGSVSVADLEYIAEFGRATGMTVVEAFEPWREPGAARLRFLNDNVHLTPRGYREIAQAVASVLP
jgi:lysophospholipase L1-like esterase